MKGISCITPDDRLRKLHQELNIETTEPIQGNIQWSRTSNNSYEVSSRGDKRFSALNARFKPGTIIDGIDVGGRTIEDVYQHVIKKSRKGMAPARDSILYNESLKTQEEREDYSYIRGYLPLWQEWARQNPELIEELREKAKGKTLTDQFANTRVSQARALADILNSSTLKKTNNYIEIHKGNWTRSEEITMEDILSTVRDFCIQKGIEQEEWSNYEDEAIDYVRKVFNGENPEVIPVQSGIERAKNRLLNIIDTFRSFVKEGPDFKRDHKYLVKNEEGEWVPAEISVSSYGKELNESNRFNIRRYTPQEVPMNIGMALGNSFDSIARDFFAGELKDEYPNMNKEIRDSLVKSLTLFKAQLDRKFPDGYYVESRPFPIAARTRDVNGKPFTIAGEMDLVVTDSEGNLYIYDMKTVRNTRDRKKAIESYQNAMSLYKNILQAQFPELMGKIKGLGLLIAETKYPQLSSENVEFLEDGQILVDGTPIQEMYSGDYGMTFSTVMNRNSYITDIAMKSLVGEALESLTIEEKRVIKDFLNRGDSSDKAVVDDLVTNAEGETVTDEITVQDTDQWQAPVTQVELREIGQTVGKYVSYIVRDMQNRDTYRRAIFPELEENAFIGKPTDEVLNKQSLPKILEYIRVSIIGRVFNNTDFDSVMYPKLEYINNHFDEVMTTAAIEILKNTGWSVRMKEVTSQDMMSNEGNLVNEGEEVEEDTREAYAYEAFEIPVQQNMSQRFKSILSTMPEYRYRKETTPENTEEWVQDGIVQTPWGFIKFLDRNEVVNVLEERLHSARSIEEMMDRLRDDTNVSTFNWFLQIADLLDTNPELKSEFFRIFRRNRAKYVQTSVEDVYTYDYRTGESGRETRRESYELVRMAMINRIKSDFANNIIDGKSELIVPSDVPGKFNIDRDELTKKITYLKGLKRPEQRKIVLADTLMSLGYDDLSQYIESLPINDHRIDDLYKAAMSALYDMLKVNAMNIVSPWNTIQHNGKYSAFNGISTVLADILPAKYEASAYDKGKNYQVYILPSYIGDLIESLTENSPEEIVEFIEKRFGQTFQTSWRDENGDIHFISSWIDDIYRNPERASEMQMFIETSFNDKQYKEMGQSTYPLSAIAEYFMPARDHIHPDDVFARFSVPVVSDKPVARYIENRKFSFLKESPDVQKEEIARRLADFALMEIKKMQTVYQDARSGKGVTIDTYTPVFPEKALTKKSGISLSDMRDKKGNLLPWTKTGGFGFRFIPQLNEIFRTGGRGSLADRILKIVNRNSTAEDRMSLVDDLTVAIMDVLENDFNNGFLQYFEEIGMNIETVKQMIPDYYKDKTVGLQEYYWNQVLAAANIFSMTIIDPAFYENATKVQKRFSQIHSMTERPNVSATFIDRDGTERALSDGKHRYIVVDDRIVRSSLDEIAVKLFDRLIERTDNAKTKEWLKKQRDMLVDSYRDINVTDGQAFSTPEGFMKKLGMIGYLSEGTKNALLNIAEGVYDANDIGEVIQEFKPFVFTWETVGEGENTINVPVQLKDSEALLFMSGVFAASLEKQGIAMKNNPLATLFKVMHDSAYTDGVWNGKGIDTIVFKSAVKNGAYNVIPDISSIEDSEERERVLNEYISMPGYVHEHPFYDWGKQQNVPAHMQDHEQAMPSQTRVLAIANLPDDSDIYISGKHMTGRQLKQEYFSRILDDIDAGMGETRKLFALDDSAAEQTEAMSDFLTDVLRRDERTTSEELKAVSIRNGDFNIPLGDPITQERYSSSIFSAIKNRVNKEKIPGGPVVQVSCYGLNPPKVVTKPDGRVNYIEVYVTCPTSWLEDRITKEDGTLMSIDEIFKEGILTDEQLSGVASRIPVEEKYSIYPIRIKGFLPRILGEMIVFPEETTKINGSDFDVDKGYPEFKYTYSNMTDAQRNKNRIIELQEAALKSLEGSAFLLDFQNIKELKNIAELINPKYKENSYSMIFPQAQFYYQNQNMAGKQMVSISASSSVAHALGTLTDIRIAAPDLTFNGISLTSLKDGNGYIRLDPAYSPFDGSLIGRSTGMLVGASADNTKDPVIAAIGYTKVSANLFNSMLRIGIPLKTVALFMSQPIIKRIVTEVEMYGGSFKEALLNEVIEVAEKNHTTVDNFLSNAVNMDFSDEALMDNLDAHNPSFHNMVLAAAYSLMDMTDGVYRISQLLRLNSVNSAVGPDIWTTVKAQRAILEFRNEIANGREVSSGVVRMFPADTMQKLENDLPFLMPLMETYTNLLPELMMDKFIPFSPVFTGLLDVIGAEFGYIDNISTKQLKSIFNEFMLYLATMPDSRDNRPAVDGSFNNRKKVFYETPMNIMEARTKVRNSFLDSLTYNEKASQKAAIPALVLNTAQLPSEVRDNLSASWATLVNTSDGKKDSRLQNISDSLIEYSLMRNGFMFSPQGFFNLAPNVAKNTFKGNDNAGIEGRYTSLVDAKNWQAWLMKKDYYNFLQQYARNHLYDKNMFVTRMDFDKSDYITDRQNANHIIINDRVFIPDGPLVIRDKKNIWLRENPVARDFYKVTPLGFNKQGLEYNTQEAGINMVSVRSWNSLRESNQKALGVKYGSEETVQDTTSEETSKYSAEGFFKRARTAKKAASTNVTVQWGSVQDFLKDMDVLEWTDEHIDRKTVSDEETAKIANLGESKDAVTVLKKMLKDRIGGKYSELENQIEEFIKRQNFCK